MDLDIELFFFNAQTDYLPYFRRTEIRMEQGYSVIDLLEALQTPFGGFAYLRTLVRINGKVVDATLPLDTIVEHFGTALKIEPASIYRATHDLCFDDSDFMQRYTLLEPYCTEEDRTFYQTLYHVHYASEAFTYNRDYVGDALILLAHRLIQNGHENRDAILDLLEDRFNGIALYEPEQNSLPQINLETEVTALKAAIKGRRPGARSLEKGKGMLERLKQKMLPDAEVPGALSVLTDRYGPIEGDSTLAFLDAKVGITTLASDTVHRFEGFNVALHYGADDAQKVPGEMLLDTIGATSVIFEHAARSSGEKIAEEAPELAFQKAGRILLDAMDQNADILVVDAESTRRHFNDKRCAEAVGRDIDLQIVTTAQLVAAATGTTDKKRLEMDGRITFI